MGTMAWHPKWWREESHGSAWLRAKEAMKRDWEQTKSDMHAGGRDLNQNVSDTVKQATGKEPIPRTNAPSLSWDDAESPMAFGYGARTQYGRDHQEWNDKLEGTLRSEWEQGRDKTRRAWEDVKSFVKRGYEHAKR